MSNDLRVVAIVAVFEKFSTADFVVCQRLRTVFHQRVRPHVVVGTHHQPRPTCTSGEVAIAAVAGSKEVFDQPLQPLVAQPLMQISQELFFLPGAHIVEFIVRPASSRAADNTSLDSRGLESSKTIIRTEWPLRQKCSSYCSTVSPTSLRRCVGTTKNNSVSCIVAVRCRSSASNSSSRSSASNSSSRLGRKA